MFGMRPTTGRCPLLLGIKSKKAEREINCHRYCWRGKLGQQWPCSAWSPGNRDGHCFHQIGRLHHQKEDPELHPESLDVRKRTSRTRTWILASGLRSELVTELSTAENWWGAQREITAENKITTDKEAEGGISSHGER